MNISPNNKLSVTTITRKANPAGTVAIMILSIVRITVKSLSLEFYTEIT